MFKNFSSLDHRSIISSILLQTLLPQKKKKALCTGHTHRKQNKTKTKPLKGPTFHLTSHSSTPLDFAQCQRGNFGQM